MTESQLGYSRLKFLFRAYKYRYRIDKAELKYLCSSVKPGMTVLDIGSHKGGYLFWMSKKVGKSGKVMAFEPQPLLYNYLKEVISSFPLRNVTLFQKGVSSRTSVETLSVSRPEGNPSPGATLERRNHPNGHQLEVSIVDLDSFLSDRTKPIAFIKIDVEGHEFEVLQGAKNILKKDRPSIILECENRHLTNHTTEDIFKFLYELNYQGYFIHMNRVKSLREFDPVFYQNADENRKVLDTVNYVNNFIFEPIEPDSQQSNHGMN